VRVAMMAFPVLGLSLDDRLSPVGMDLIRECPPLSLYWLPEIWRKQGVDIDIFDFISRGTTLDSATADQLRTYDLIAITATSMSWPTTLLAIRVLRSGPSPPIVLGGPHATIFDRYVIENHGVDFVVRGEGEHALPELCQAMKGNREFSQVSNLSWRDPATSAFCRAIQAPRTPQTVLQELPPPNYAALPNGVYQGLSIESSRGCPFECSFCSTNYLKSYRQYSPDSFVTALAAIAHDVPKSLLQMIHVVDDEFTLNTKRVRAVMSELNRTGLQVQLTYDSRANDLLDPSFVEALAPHTFEFLVGAECGYDEGLLKIGKGTTTAKLRQAAANLASVGLAPKAHFSFILGLPWETEAEVSKTVRFAADLGAQYGVKVLLQWYLQIPGSRLWADASKRGIVSPRLYDSFGFFSDPYLFFSGVPLQAEQIWRISDVINLVKWTLRLTDTRREPLAYSIPGAVARFFPRESEVDFATLREAVGVLSDTKVAAN
jgi:anaerobic magnesium-protoporphyrin IX monomethyl ester cyclase